MNAVLLPSLRSSSSRSKGALIGIILGSVSIAIVILASVLLLFRKLHQRSQAGVVKNQSREFCSTLMAGFLKTYERYLSTGIVFFLIKTNIFHVVPQYQKLE